MRNISTVSGETVEASPKATASHLPPPPPVSSDLPQCESCGLRPASLVWIDEIDLMGFYVCPTCHVDWSDR